jgi:hypothetical protein
MNDRRLRAHLAELELTAALLIYANTLDEPEPEPVTEPDLLRPVSNVIPLRRPSPRKK